jgi:hypothetical protein
VRHAEEIVRIISSDAHQNGTDEKEETAGETVGTPLALRVLAFGTPVTLVLPLPAAID